MEFLLVHSIDFWNGAWLDEPAKTGCVAETEIRVQGIAKDIWLLVGRKPSERGAEAMDALQVRVKDERKLHATCEGTSSLDTIELRLLLRRLKAYDDALTGLRKDDDARVRGAMDEEQRLLARANRCRQEHQMGEPSTECSP